MPSADAIARTEDVDLDLLAATSNPREVVEAFGGLPNVGRVLGAGPTKCSVLTRNGLQVDLRVVGLEEFGTALQYFTGSKAHNVKVREHAVRMGLKLSEYGLFRAGERIAGSTEEEVYTALGMQTPPAPRERHTDHILRSRSPLPEAYHQHTNTSAT